MTDLIERLRAEVRQRQYESGDMLYLGAPDPLLTEAADEIAALRARVAEMEAALEWYGEQARLARLIHSGGDAGRHALADDGGKRARAAIAAIGGDRG